MIRILQLSLNIFISSENFLSFTCKKKYLFHSLKQFSENRIYKNNFKIYEQISVQPIYNIMFGLLDMISNLLELIGQMEILQFNYNSLFQNKISFYLYYLQV